MASHRLWPYLILTLIASSFAVAIRTQTLGLLASQTADQTAVIRHRPKPVAPPKSISTTASATIPTEKILPVPFTSQAPLAHWDPLHEEACEEASLMMVAYAKNQKNFGSPQIVDDEINRLVSWEEAHGYKVDLTVAQLARVAANFYGLKTGRVINSLTADKIKQEIAAGRLVIVPAAGQVLPNPYFTAPGPKYHMLVVRGYTATEFITNDPGTKRGENFRYSYNGLLNAVHDWDEQNILNGQRRALVFD